MTGALALAVALSVASQIQVHPTGLKSVGLSHGRSGVRTVQILDKLYEQAGKPSLDFDFARYGDLHDNASGETSLVTFARASSGTYVASDGLIKRALVNNLLYSDEFNRWSTSRSTVLANQIASPDGKQTADYIQQQSGQTLIGGVYRTITLAGQLTVSVYAKASDKKFMRIQVQSDGAWFDIENGVAGTVTNGTSSVQSVGNGWYRCSYSTSHTGSTNVVIYNADADNSTTVTDSGGIYIWGAQLVEGSSPGPYIRTTSAVGGEPRFDHDPVTGESLGLLVEEARTNLLKYSRDLTQADWVDTDVTVALDQTGADGVTSSASSLTATAGNGTVLQAVTSASAARATSAYVKRITGTGTIEMTQDGGSTWTAVTVTAAWTRVTIPSATVTDPEVGFRIVTSGDAIAVDFVQLETGAFSTSAIPTTTAAATRAADVAAVQDADFSTTNLLAYSEAFTSWGDTNISRDSATETAPDGQSTALQVSASSANGTVIYPAAMSTSAERVFSIYLRRVTGTGDIQYTLDNGSNWTTQTITSTWQRYIFPKTTAAQRPGIRIVTSGDAIEMWGASLTATEYPVAYTTTRNLLTDSQDFERGTWYKSGVTITPNAIASPNGSLTADKFTVSSSDVFGQQVTVPTSQQVTFSTYIKRGNNQWVRFGVWDAIGGAPVGVHQFRAWINLQTKTLGTQSTTGNGVLNSVSVADVGNDWLRLSITGSITGFQLYAPVVVSAANDNDFTRVNGAEWYLWGAQLEPGTVATDYVRTVDTVGKAYRWYEPTEGTVWAEYIVDAPTGTRVVAALSDGSNASAQNEIRAVVTGGGASGMYVETLNVGQADLFQLASVTVGNVTGHISAFKNNSFAYKTNTGMTLKTDGSGIVPVVTKLFLGGYEVGGSVFSGRIRRLTYWPVRQPDATLQVITQ